MEVHANVSTVIDACCKIKKANYPQAEHSKHRTKIEILLLFKARQLSKRVLLQHLDAPLFFLLCLNGHSCSCLLGCLVVQLILPYVLQETILDMFWLFSFAANGLHISSHWCEPVREYSPKHNFVLSSKRCCSSCYAETDELQPITTCYKEQYFKGFWLVMSKGLT